MIAATLREIFPAPCAVAVRDANAVSTPLWNEEAALVANAMPKRKREFAAGRLAARAALAELGLGAAVIGCGPDRAPQWPDGAIGSIAHADDRVVAVTARRNEMAAIGLDLERDCAVREEVWRQIMTGPEMESLRRFTPDERPRWATVVFCAKEAFYKFQYPIARVWLEFSAVTVEIDAARRFFTIVSRESISVGDMAVNTFTGRFAFADTFVLAGLYLPCGASDALR